MISNHVLLTYYLKYFKSLVADQDLPLMHTYITGVAHIGPVGPGLHFISKKWEKYNFQIIALLNPLKIVEHTPLMKSKHVLFFSLQF